MARNPLVTDKVTRLIAYVYLEHPEWVAKEIQAEVHKRLRKDDPHVKQNWPGLSAVQKKLTSIRLQHKENPSPLDAPWSIGCLAKYDIPPEALPAVMYIYEYHLGPFRRPGPHFSIREALWVCRLYKVIDDLDFLERFASFYAQREHVHEMLNVPLYTPDYDQLLTSYRNDPAAFKESLGMQVLARTSEELKNIQKKLSKRFFPGDQVID